jgi:central kinetochore subunit Mal2/MCM21
MDNSNSSAAAPTAEAQELESLDAEIIALNQQIAAQKARRKHLSSILLSVPDLPVSLGLRPKKSSSSSLFRAAQTPYAEDPDSSLPPTSRLALQSWTRQQRQNLETAYRVCAGITAFQVRNPDPHAVGNGDGKGGKMLGVRIEVFGTGRYAECYHLLFDVEDEQEGVLKLARHTIPAWVGVEALARRAGLGTRDRGRDKEGLFRFVRRLRCELVRWHRRCAALSKLQRESGLPTEGKSKTSKKSPGSGPDYDVLNSFHADTAEDNSDEDEDSSEEEQEGLDKPSRLVEVYANPEVRKVYLAWSDGKTAVLQVDPNAEVEKAHVRWEREQAENYGWDLERRLPGPLGTLYARLASYEEGTES